MQKISIKTISAEGVETTQTLIRSGENAVRVNVPHGSKIFIEIDGVNKSVNVNKKLNAAKDLQLKQIGSDLFVQSEEGETLLEVVDFYGAAGSSIGEVTWTYVDGGITTQVSASPESVALDAVGLSGQGISTETKTDTAAVGMSGTGISSDTETSSLLPITPASVLGVSAVGAGVALAGGSAASASTGTALTTTVEGTVLLGPVKSGSNLRVTLYKADGTAIEGASATVDDTGHFKVSIPTSYKGTITARVTDTNGAQTDYIDEATGRATALTTDIRAVFNAPDSGTATISITPLSELAVRLLLGDSGGTNGASGVVLGAKTAADITTVNTSVATKFGLNGDVVLGSFVPTVDANGNATTDANFGGQVLAALSGLDQVYGGTSQALTELTKNSASVDALSDLIVVGGAFGRSPGHIADVLGFFKPQRAIRYRCC